MARLALISGIGACGHSKRGGKRRTRKGKRLGAWMTTGPVASASAALSPSPAALAGVSIFKGLKKGGKKLVCEAKTAFIERKYGRAAVLAQAALGKRLGAKDKTTAIALLKRLAHGVQLGKI